MKSYPGSERMMIALVVLMMLVCPQPAVAAEPVIYDIPLTAAQQRLVYETAEQYELPYTLCLAVMATESSYDPLAKCGNSAGMMQLNSNTYPALAEDLGIKDFDVYDFADNVQVGIYKLSLERDHWQEQGYSDEEVFAAMLISYNRGRTGARRYIERYGMEAKYVDKVSAYKGALERGEYGG